MAPKRVFLFITGYFIVHFVQFLFAMLFVYGVVIPIQEGRYLEWLTNFGFIM